MAKPLDFIVFGVPRSGTSAFCRALNLHPEIFCALARFYYKADHARITFPDSFLSERDIKDPFELKKIGEIRDALDAKPDVRFVGNKLPRYYYALSRVNGEVPGLKNLWIYRSPAGFMQSWNRRERGHKKGRWGAGQVGVFGFLDLLCCLESCVTLDKDVFVFPFTEGLTQSSRPILEAVQFIGADPASFDVATFTAEHLPFRQEARHRLPLLPHEEELLEGLETAALDAMLESYCGVMSPELRRGLADYLDHITPRLPAVLDRVIPAYGNPAVTAYGTELFLGQKRELAGVAGRAQGSAMIAEFQRRSLLKGLKALYAQRWGLRRRLMARRVPGFRPAQASRSQPAADDCQDQAPKL